MCRIDSKQKAGEDLWSEKKNEADYIILKCPKLQTKNQEDHNYSQRKRQLINAGLKMTR